MRGVAQDYSGDYKLIELNLMKTRFLTMLGSAGILRLIK